MEGAAAAGLQTAHGDGQLSFDGAWGDVECRGDPRWLMPSSLASLKMMRRAAFGELFHSVGQRAVQQLKSTSSTCGTAGSMLTCSCTCKAGHTVPVAAQQVVGTTVAHGAVDIGIEVFDAAERSAAFHS